jgi:hypothetical protein
MQWWCGLAVHITICVANGKTVGFAIEPGVVEDFFGCCEIVRTIRRGQGHAIRTYSVIQFTVERRHGEVADLQSEG